MAKYKRVLLKLSGESLMGEKQYGIDEKRLAEYAAQIKEIHELGVQIGIVIGGGNIFRGLSGANKGFDRVKGDQMGMLATVINSLALSSALVAAGVQPYAWNLSVSFTINGKQSNLWKQAKWLSCLPEQAIRSLLPTQALPYVALKLKPTLC